MTPSHRKIFEYSSDDIDNLGFISLMILTVVGTVTIVVGVDFVACVGFGVAVGFVIAVGFVVGDGAAVGIDVYLPISVS